MVVPRDGGDHLHFLNHLATVKVAGSESGSLSVVEFSAPRGFGPPLHQHRDEDELFFVIEGETTARLGDETLEADTGACFLLPHGRPHSFQIVSETARLLTVTAKSGDPATFDGMVRALGVPTEQPVLPQPGPIDPEEVGRVCAEYGIDVVGPPPAPLS